MARHYVVVVVSAAAAVCQPPACNTKRKRSPARYSTLGCRAACAFEMNSSHRRRRRQRRQRQRSVYTPLRAVTFAFAPHNKTVPSSIGFMCTCDRALKRRALSYIYIYLYRHDTDAEDVVVCVQLLAFCVCAPQIILCYRPNPSLYFALFSLSFSCASCMCARCMHVCILLGYCLVLLLRILRHRGTGG